MNTFSDLGESERVGQKKRAEELHF